MSSPFRDLGDEPFEMREPVQRAPELREPEKWGPSDCPRCAGLLWLRDELCPACEAIIGASDPAHDPVPPFPQEPAFGSPEAVEQAAETIRGLGTAEYEHRQRVLADEACGRLGERLREAEQQRDALADALEPLLDLIATDPAFGNRPDVVAAVAAIDAALRKAGR
jgi:hypothetical protein